eukprot:5096133-Karenia_brevis.AAC.1
MFYWEGEGSLGAVHQKQLAKGIGKGNLAKYGRRILHPGNGCNSEGLRDRWTPGSPKLTFPMACAMYATAIKVP